MINIPYHTSTKVLVTEHKMEGGVLMYTYDLYNLSMEAANPPENNLQTTAPNPLMSSRADPPLELLTLLVELAMDSMKLLLPVRT